MSSFSDLIEAVELGDLERVRAILDQSGDLVHSRDSSGATALHHAAFHGHIEVAELLLDRCADVNATDRRFGATPAGWAIEYLRERGAFLGIELADFAYAIQQGDVRWVARFLTRFPTLRVARDASGKPFRQLAQESNNREIIALLR